jgi:hypothetical protein
VSFDDRNQHLGGNRSELGTTIGFGLIIAEMRDEHNGNLVESLSIPVADSAMATLENYETQTVIPFSLRRAEPRGC